MVLVISGALDNFDIRENKIFWNFSPIAKIGRAV
jgi:hypothetical protein